MSGTLQVDGKLTKKSDRQGLDVFICVPGWFDKRDIFKIFNAPPRTAHLEFSGQDLNYLARVLYAEAAGAAPLPDKDERKREKAAILNVKHFRLNRTDYPNRQKAKTFKEVCDAKGQFESVFSAKPKYVNSSEEFAVKFDAKECSDLSEAIQAVREFIENGPSEIYMYDNFRGGKGGRGNNIGLSRFWLTSVGEKLYAAEK
jgi:hypothetical protein